MSIRAELMKMGLRTLRWRQQQKDYELEDVRQAFEEFASRAKLPKSLRYSSGRWAGVPGEHLMQGEAERAGLLLYFHGGGYSFCSAATHRKSVGLLSSYLGFPAIVPDYALAPEHPYPAALHQAIDVYEHLQAINPERPIVLGGDSAGGGLAVALMLKLREREATLPRAAVLLSPWLDLTCSEDSYQRNKEKDLLLGHSDPKRYAKYYYQDEDPRNPYISPLFANLSGLPPMLIQATNVEIFIDEIRSFAAKAEHKGVDLQLEESKNLFHVWQLFSGIVPEGKKALQRAARFCIRNLQ